MFRGEEHGSSQRKHPFKGLSLQPSLALMWTLPIFDSHIFVSLRLDVELICSIVSFYK